LAAGACLASHAVKLRSLVALANAHRCLRDRRKEIEPFAPRAADHLAATQVTCGEVITTDTRLSRDLNNCPADGFIIGASRVTLDLDGHTIDGVGMGIGVNNSGGTTA
jgi:hypothetical protein